MNTVHYKKNFDFFLNLIKIESNKIRQNFQKIKFSKNENCFDQNDFFLNEMIALHCL